MRLPETVGLENAGNIQLYLQFGQLLDTIDLLKRFLSENFRA